MSQFPFAANCSRAQEFYSLIVLNVPCWLSQGLLQRLDPRAVWVYGLRYRRGGTPRYAKPSYFFQVFSSAGEASVQCVLQGCFYWYLCVETFLIMTYINLRGAHIFCCRYRQTLRAIHRREVLFKVKCGLLTASSKPTVNVCSVWRSGTKRLSWNNFLYCFSKCSLFHPSLPCTFTRKLFLFQFITCRPLVFDFLIFPSSQ